MTEVYKSTCSYCGVGCGIEIRKHRDGRMELRGDEQHSTNRGMLCSKGRSLLHTVRATETRLHYPTMRSSRGAERERASWDAAIGHIATEFRRIIDAHGPNAVAFYVSGQCLTEEYYLANKIAKGFIGTNNIDTNSRLCMSSAVAGYKATLGADAPPISYDDIELADTFLIAGANPAWCHPIIFRRIESRKAADPAVKMIVIDPRRTASASVADLHLQIRPGTDVALFLAIARQLRQTGQLDPEFLRDHTEGAEAFFESVEEWTLQRAAKYTGVAEHDIALAASWLAGTRRFLSMWTMGLNQSAVGTDKNIALISLSLITGKIGKPGCGPFSLTGQPNAMGGREVGGMANLLSAHRNLANPVHRAEVAAFWKVPSVPEKPGLTAVELFNALEAGTVKAVWIIATNPAASMPESSHIERALGKAELVIAQDIYPTATTRLADVILPAAGWLEKAGTMTSSDRTISLLQKVIEPPGEALADVDILLRFAREMGWRKHFAYASPADIFAEHVELTRGTDIDITALSHELLAKHGSGQWPAPANGNIARTSRLYTDHRFRTASGRAQLTAIQVENRSEPVTQECPLILTTGRIRDQWHTMTKTGRVNRLNMHIDSPYCEIHPADAAARQIAENDIVCVKNGRGEARIRAVVTPDVRQRVVFLPMHWGKRLNGKGESARANNVTSPRMDPVSREPDLKFAAVQVSKLTMPRRRIVIVGAGAAAMAFIEKHRQYNSRDDIVVFGAEAPALYNRVMLPHYIDGSASWESLVRADCQSFHAHRVIFHGHTTIYRIDRREKIIYEAQGRSSPYDVLILATGARPAIHYDGPFPETGTHTLRSRRDADAIITGATPGKRVVIQGGGLLGLELAHALKRRGCHVIIVQRSDRLMGKQLDATAAGYLAMEMADRDIDVLFNAALVQVVGDECVTAVRIALPESSLTLPCDLFIFATGIVPNKELGGGAGLDCNRGILVNEHLQTSDPNICAIGECAEFDGQTFGTTPAAVEQANALAEYLRGNDHSSYKPSASANILKIEGLQLAAAGEPDPPLDDGSVDIVTLNDPGKRHYQKCVIRDDRLVGVICMGDMTRFSQYLGWISSGMELDELRDTLLRPAAAAVMPDGPIVCSCHQVGATTIQRLALAHHCDMNAVCAQSKAGTGCGSCKPEVAKLIAGVRTTGESAA